MRINSKTKSHPKTHGGAPAARGLTDLQKLRRSVMSCLLWEDTFYEDGQSITDRIKEHAENVDPGALGSVALEARNSMHLRHVPLLLCSILSRTGKGSWEVGEVIRGCVKRADEIPELLAIHAKLNNTTPDNLKKHITAQMKRGLGLAFRNFDEHQLAKYDRAGPITLRDAMRLVHPRPESANQSYLWKRLLDGKLKTPDTWEVNLSKSEHGQKKTDEEKREVWERMLHEEKLGYMALLRNLRNMEDVGVDRSLINSAILARKGARNVLPFRYVAAAREAKSFSQSIDTALQEAISYLPKLPGTTVVLVDVSGSMVGTPVSKKSKMDRMTAASTLASMFNCEDIRVFTFSNKCVEVPPYRGLAGVEAIRRSQPHGGTAIDEAIEYINSRIHAKIKHDRIIVITDEQATGRLGFFCGSRPVPDPVVDKAYFLNVGTYENGVGYGRWTHIDGFSENVIRYIVELESRDWMEVPTSWRRNTLRD